MELYFEITAELELNGLQEIHSQHLKLLITKAFFSFSFFLIRYKKIWIFKGNFQKYGLFLSLGLLRHRCFLVGTSTVLRDFNQMPGLRMKSEKSN